MIRVGYMAWKDISIFSKGTFWKTAHDQRYETSDEDIGKRPYSWRVLELVATGLHSGN